MTYVSLALYYLCRDTYRISLRREGLLLRGESVLVFTWQVIDLNAQYY